MSKHAFDTGELLVDHVGGAMRDTAHRAAARRHAIANELVAAEDIEQLKLHVVSVFASLCNAPHDHRLDTEYRPVVEIHIDARGWLLQHVVLGYRREAPAARQVIADNL